MPGCGSHCRGVARAGGHRLFGRRRLKFRPGFGERAAEGDEVFVPECFPGGFGLGQSFPVRQAIAVGCAAEEEEPVGFHRQRAEHQQNSGQEREALRDPCPDAVVAYAGLDAGHGLADGCRGSAVPHSHQLTEPRATRDESHRP